METDRSAKESRKAAKRTRRRKKQAQAIADAEVGGTLADGSESLPTSFWKFATVIVISIAWIVFVAIQDWGPVVNVLGLLFVGIPFGVVSWLKGRRIIGVFGFFIWPLAVISAIRLARPFSWWFDRFYVPTSKEIAEHPLSSSATSSARRSLTRRIGQFDDSDIRAVNEAYVMANAIAYLESEWGQGRGQKEDPLPGHYRGLFQFFNIIDDDIPDSADPTTLGEYWAYCQYDPWAESDQWPPNSGVPSADKAVEAEGVATVQVETED